MSHEKSIDIATPVARERILHCVETVLGVGLFAAAIVLFAHHRYVDVISVYPGTDWTFFPMFHAAFTALGTLSLASGWFFLRSRPVEIRELVALVVATIVVASLYASVLLTVTEAEGVNLEGNTSHRALVGGTIAGFYAVAYGLVRYQPVTVALGFFAPLVVLPVVVRDWLASDSTLAPVVDGFILLTNPGILGVEYLGTALIITGGILGFTVGLAETVASRIVLARADEDGG